MRERSSSDRARDWQFRFCCPGRYHCRRHAVDTAHACVIGDSNKCSACRAICAAAEFGGSRPSPRKVPALETFNLDALLRVIART